MHYNLLNFGNNCGNVDQLDKYSWLGNILEEARPDVLTVNELNPNPIFSNGIISRSFGYSDAFDRALITNKANSPIVNQLFYNKDKLRLEPLPESISIIRYSLRDINAYKLFVKGSGENGMDSLFFYCVVGHFKATDDPASANSRNVAAQAIMNWITQHNISDPIILMADFNIYGPSEAAYQTLTNNSNASISLIDPHPTVGWGGAGGAPYYTQSTRSSTQDCGSGGGLDDRFDMMLFSSELMDNSADLKLLTGTYKPFGNDGNTYNQALGCVGNNEVPFDVCTSLILMSDHLPVVAELEASSVVSIEKNIIPGLGLKLFPQPATDLLQLELLSNEIRTESYQLSIRNVLGQEIFKTSIQPEITRMSISLKDYQAGVYFLKIEDAQRRFVSRKVWKQG